jgi:hypothetical protein
MEATQYCAVVEDTISTRAYLNGTTNFKHIPEVLDFV